MRKFLTIAIFISMLAGCANIGSLLPTPAPASAPSSTSVPVTATATLPSPTAPPSGPPTLHIWVPPQFDPSSGTPAGRLLQARLDEFRTRHAGLQIDVRVKSESGPSSLLNALSATKLAAPSILPDLIALSRPDLESATAKGLLHPFDGMPGLPEESDWYPYAWQMAHIQNSTFGLPFAGDALAMVGLRYPLPTSWSEIPEDTIIVFPAADPQALFTLSLYLSAGGTLQDSQGHIALNEGVLADVLALYLRGVENNFISPQVVNYEDNEQAWGAFTEQRGNLVISWTSRFMEEAKTQLALAPLPGFDNGNYTLATGWSWALAGSSMENQPVAAELAEYLSDGQFMGKWNQAAGYLPTRPSALSSWDDARTQLSLTQIAESATLIPSQELLVTIGPIFADAVSSVLSGGQTPQEAAKSAVEQTR